MTHVWWLLRFAAPATRTLAVSVLARVLGQLLGVVLLALPCWAVGKLAVDASCDGSFVAVVVGIVVAVALAKAALRYLEQLTGHLAAFSLLAELRIWLLDRLIPQAPGGLDRWGATEVQQTAVRDVDRIEVFFAHTIAPAVSAIVVPVVAVAVAGALAGPVMALTLAAVLAASLLLLLTTGRLTNSARATAAARAAIAAHVADTARLHDELAMYEADNVRRDQLALLDDRLGERLRADGRNNGLRAGGTDLRVWLGTVILLAVGVVTLAGTADAASQLPTMLAVSSFVVGTAPSVDAVVRLATSLPAGLAATERVRALAARPAPVAEPVDSVTPQPSLDAPALELDAVTFGFDGGPVLREVTLSVAAGAKIGIVGASGSGKSTVARLAQRYWDPGSGSVRLGGVDARELGSVTVRRLVAMADQDAFVHAGTVADNLRLASPTATDDELAHAAKLAQLELSMATPVGRRGNELSGGQRQRLAIARTLLRSWTAPRADDSLRALSAAQRILVLDEATSYQDPLTQAELVRALSTLPNTLLIIAHRLETVRELDEIFVMDAGQIVQRGTWQELVSTPGPFRELLEQQLD